MGRAKYDLKAMGFEPDAAQDFVDGKYADALRFAFLWCETPQGHEYWNAFDEQMDDGPADLPEEAIATVRDMLAQAQAEGYTP